MPQLACRIDVDDRILEPVLISNDPWLQPNGFDHGLAVQRPGPTADLRKYHVDPERQEARAGDQIGICCSSLQRSEFYVPQPQSAADDGNGTQAHRGTGDDWAEQQAEERV